MKKYEKILLRKDGGKLTLNGYYRDRGTLLFDVLYSVSMQGPWIELYTNVPNTDHVAQFENWLQVSGFLMDLYALPLYGMDKADRKVMDFFAEREKMMDHATKEYAFPKSERKGFPPAGVTERAVKEVESFRDWKRRKEHFENLKQQNA